MLKLLKLCAKIWYNYKGGLFMENNFDDNNKNIDINEEAKAASENEILEAAEAMAKAKEDDIKSCCFYC